MTVRGSCIMKTLESKSEMLKIIHLNTVLKNISRYRKAFFPIYWLAEDNKLFEKEDPPLFSTGQQTAVLLCY